MQITSRPLSIVSVSLIALALALAGCASAEPSAFTGGLLRSTCGPAGGNFVDLVLAPTELACGAPAGELPATRLSVYAFGNVSALESVEVEGASAAERCTDGACVGITGGTLETLRTEGDRAELRWSLTLADGTLDEGTAWVRVCGAAPIGCF